MDDWSGFHEERTNMKSFPRWPESVLLKLVFGNYLRHPIELAAASRVLDVGCGFGNNLLPFADQGHEVFGVELSSSICEIAERFLRERGHESRVHVGHNRELPFEDGFFHLLLSVNVVHYEESAERVAEALSEYRRVLRTDGRLVLVTVGPLHEIRAHSDAVGDDQFEIREYDFRDGTRMHFFSDPQALRGALEQAFSDVEVGRVTEDLMSRQLDFFLATGSAHP